MSWRSVFAINVPLGLLAAYLARRTPSTPPVARGRYEPDVVGTALFCFATLGLLVTLSSAGHGLVLDSWPLYVLVALVAVAYVALYRWERASGHPVIPVRLLRRPEIARPDIVVVCFAAALFACSHRPSAGDRARDGRASKRRARHRRRASAARPSS